MTNEEALVFVSVDTVALSPDHLLPVKLEVERHHRKRTVNHAYRLSETDFEQLKPLLSGRRVKECGLSTLPVVEDVLELKYANSLLREYMLDFSATDIVRLYKNNKMLLCPLVNLRKLIRRSRRANKPREAHSYSSLLRKLRSYCPEVISMDVKMMDAGWFAGFKNYLLDGGCSPEETALYMELLWRVYSETCRLSGAKELFSPEGDCGDDFSENAFSRFVHAGDIERLLALRIKDEGVASARNLLLLKHYAPEVAFADLLELKQEDVHEDGIWYRRRSDNRLCFVALSCGAVVLIRKRMGGGGNLLLHSPFEDMEDWRKRLELKLEYYKEQLDKLVRIHP